MRIIVDDIGTVVSALQNTTPPLFDPALKLNAGAPFYEYGHPLVINNLLKMKDKDKVHKYEKYPLIILRLDTPEGIGNEVINYNLNIVMLAATGKDYTPAERWDATYRQILYPLYDAFFDALYISGLFVWAGQGERPPHTKTDRPYWGESLPNKNDMYILSDPLDAIEITNLKLNSTKSC